VSPAAQQLVIALDRVWQDRLAALRSDRLAARQAAERFSADAGVEWACAWSSTPDLASFYANLARKLIEHALKTLVTPGLSIEIDHEALQRWPDPPDHHSYTTGYRGDVSAPGSDMAAKWESYLSAISFAPLWRRLEAVLGGSAGERRAAWQALSRLRRTFYSYLSPDVGAGRRQPAMAAGRHVVEAQVWRSYSGTDLSCDGRRSIHETCTALAAALILSGEVLAGDALAQAADAVFNWQTGTLDASYPGRTEVNEDLTLRWFKEKVQFRMSPRLFQAVGLLAADPPEPLANAA
jgi:hypothetical protein